MKTKDYAATLEIEELADLIRYHADKYFNDDQEITDAEYDDLIKEMKSRDEEHPVLGEVGANPTYGKKVAHDEVMGSLNKLTYDEKDDDADEDTVQELTDWAVGVASDGIVTADPKIDGLAVKLIYDNGELVQAATRGNGAIGQDVTDNVREIASIPNKIGYLDYVEVRGEIYMKKAIFRKIRDAKIAAGEKKIPANPRNLASGTLQQKDPKETGKLPLHFFAYDLRGIDPIADTEHEVFKVANDFFPEFEFVRTDKMKADHTSILAVIKDWERHRDDLDYCIDGMVISVNDLTTQKKLGYKGRCPVGKMAFKFRPEQQLSRLVDIVWQLGRTGRLTPVAQIEAVEIDGSIVDSPTLHNYAQIKVKDICIGDELLIEKAGDIIPQVVRVTEQELKDRDREDRSSINYPTICPSCHEATKLDEREVSVWCKNPTCPGQAEFRIIHFLKTIEVDGVGAGIVRKLIEGGLVTTIPDLFRLDFGKVSKLEGLGRSSARNTMAAIDSQRKIHLAVFLDSLGIHGLGTTTSKNIADEFETLEQVMEIDYSCFERLDGIGEKTAKSIEEGLIAIESMVDELFEVGVEIIDAKKIVAELTGKSFCVTGTLTVGRKEMAALIESHGGTMKSSVGKGLDYLVAGDGVGKGKTDKAVKYGTEVIDEEEVRKMMGE